MGGSRCGTVKTVHQKLHVAKSALGEAGMNGKGGWGVAMTYCYGAVLSTHSKGGVASGKNAKPADGTRQRFSVISS